MKNWLYDTAIPPWICMADGDPPEPAGGSGGNPATPAPPTPASASGDTPAPDSGGSVGDPAPGGTPEPDPDVASTQLPVWARRQMDRQHRHNLDLKTKADEASARADQLQRQIDDLLRSRAAPSDDGTPPQPTPARAPVDFRTTDEFKNAAAEEGRKLAAQQQHNNALARLNDTGKEAYGNNWDIIISNLTTMGGIQRFEDLQVILAADNPAKVLFELNKVEANGEPAYARIMGISDDFQRFKALTKLGETAGAAPAPRPASSNAPAPVTPINTRGMHSGGPVDLYDPKLASPEHDDAWYAERTKQKREKWDREHRRPN